MLGSIRTGVAAGIVVLFGIAWMFYALAASAAPPGGTTAPVEFTADGKLKQPVGYRKWVYIGEVVTPNDMNDGEASFPEFHSVYVDPESFAHYEMTGKEAAIKDSKRYKDEPGHWAYFSFGHKYPLKKEVAKNAVASCNQCHEDNAAKTDRVFSKYYPVLRAAAPRSKK